MPIEWRWIGRSGTIFLVELVSKGRKAEVEAVERMPHVTVLTGFRCGARDSPPDFLDQFFSNRWPKPRVIR